MPKGRKKTEDTKKVKEVKVVKPAPSSGPVWQEVTETEWLELKAADKVLDWTAIPPVAKYKVLLKDSQEVKI